MLLQKLHHCFPAISMFNWYFQWPKRTSTRQSAELGVPHFSARCREVNLRGLEARFIPVQSRRGLAEAHVCSLVTLLCVLMCGNQHRLWAPFIIPIISFLVCSQSTQKVLCVCAPDPISGATCRPLHMSTLPSAWFQSDLKIKSFGFFCRRSQNKQDNKDCVAQCGLSCSGKRLRTSLPQRSSIMNEWLICLAMLQVNNSHAC